MKKIMMMLLGVLMVGSALATTNEIIVSASLKVDKNSTEVSKSAMNQLIQMTGTRFYSATITATTTNQALSMGNLATAGWCYWRNCSTNQKVWISTGNGANTNFMLLPSEAGVFRFAPSCVVTTLQVATTNVTGDLDFTLTEQ